jgi:hypothetical protein
MTVLDPNIQEAIDKGQLGHNWMYSFMPKNDNIYLVGFCKQCRRAFSQIVETYYPHDAHDLYKYMETELDVPKYGCKPID